MINAEIQANNNRAQALASEQNAKVVQNVAAGVVGIVVWSAQHGNRPAC
jgi:hypothetical protein